MEGCAVSLLNPKDPRLIPVPFPLFQGLIVLGEASPPDPAVDDASRPVSAEVKLEPGADRLVSASSRAMLGAWRSAVPEPGGMLEPQDSCRSPCGASRGHGPSVGPAPSRLISGLMNDTI